VSGRAYDYRVTLSVSQRNLRLMDDAGTVYKPDYIIQHYGPIPDPPASSPEPVPNG
jgi:hypothetical protein